MAEQPNPKPKKPAKVLFEDVLHPPAYEPADVGAMKALANGEANEAQQKRALDWIIYFAAATYDEPYRSERPGDTAFACGRAFVGRRILHLLKTKSGNIEEP